VEAHSLACALHWFKLIALRPSSNVSTEALVLAERLSDGDLRPETSETAFMPSSSGVMLLSTSTTRKMALPSSTLRTLSTSIAEVDEDVMGSETAGLGENASQNAPDSLLTIVCETVVAAAAACTGLIVFASSALTTASDCFGEVK